MKIPDKYDEESYVKGFKKGWGQCLGVVIGLMRAPEEVTMTQEELIETVLSKHPYHCSTPTARNE